MTATLPAGPETVPTGPARGRAGTRAGALGRRARALYSFLGPSGTIAAAVLAAMLILAVGAGLFAPYDPNQASLLDAYQGPSMAHLLGTDAIGRDVLSRLIYGSRTSLLGPALVIACSTAVGVPLALIGAWYGGLVDAGAARILDLVYALPGLLLAVITAAMFGPGLTPAVVALSIAYVPFLSRVVRAAARQQRVSPYVDALTVQGFGPWRIGARHILRNIAPMVLGQSAVAFGYALLDLAGLSYLGLAVQAPTADWGVMVSDQDSMLRGHLLPVLVPGLLVVVCVMALTVLGARIAGERPERHPLWNRRGKRAGAE
ncbi:ABC transporter permease [Catenulispora pinisilvae]|uniref:ABC transporter permease n=1 Tax=Catenulispora pinisilvae TaxID=2705253 RepID=UPI0018921CB7|nr:ABC transporter permease [Catenulispora pinisilvae]